MLSIYSGQQTAWLHTMLAEESKRESLAELQNAPEWLSSQHSASKWTALHGFKYFVKACEIPDRTFCKMLSQYLPNHWGKYGGSLPEQQRLHLRSYLREEDL